MINHRNIYYCEREECGAKLELNKMRDADVCPECGHSYSVDDRIWSMGYAREFIRRIQDMRKEANMDIMDTISIHIYYDENEWEAAYYLYAFFDQMKKIMRETKTEKLYFGRPQEKFIREWDIRIPTGETKHFTIGIEKC